MIFLIIQIFFPIVVFSVMVKPNTGYQRRWQYFKLKKFPENHIPRSGETVINSKSKETILVIDDQPNNLKSLGQYLNLSGFEVIVALSGEEALDRISHVHPDIILLDIVMPGMDGFETYEKLKNNQNIRDVPIIFLTARDDIDSKLRGLGMNATDYITKPFYNDEIIVRITKHLKIQRLQKQLEENEQRLKDELHRNKKITEELAGKEALFRQMFMEHSAPMLLIDPNTGKIIQANHADIGFYGYSSDDFFRLSIYDINLLNTEDIRVSMIMTEKRQKNIFIFPHRLKNGSVRTVEVHSSPIEINNEILIFSVIHDISDRIQAKATIQDRLRYEKGLAACSKALLDNSPTTALNHMLEAVDVGRVYLFQNFKDSKDGLCMRQTHEVCAQGVNPEIGNPALQYLPYRDGFDRWLKILSDGRPVAGVVSAFPKSERDMLESQNIKSILVLPIWARKNFYGFIGFDDTETERQWKDEDIQLLFTASEMIGGYFERTLAEKELQEERKQLLSIFDGMDECFYVSDPETYEILLINKSIKTRHGEILGRKCYEALQGKTAPCRFCTNNRIFGKNTGRTYTWENHNKLNNKWYRCIDKAIRWPDGRMVRCELAIDISDLKAAQQSLEELKYILNQSPVTAFLWRAQENWPVEFVSDNVHQFGYTPEDFYSGRLHFARIVHQDDLERVAGEVAQYSNEKERKEFEQQYRIITKTGAIRHVEDRTWIRRDASGDITHYQGIIMDVTERMKAQDSMIRLKAAIDTTRLGVTITDIEGNILYVNSAEAATHGYDVEELIGKDVGVFSPPELRNPMTQEIILKKKKYTRESVNIRKDGSVFPVQLISDTVKNPDGEPIGIVTICEDITERKRFEKMLSRQNRMLEALHETAIALITHLKTDELLRHILSRASDLVNMNEGFIHAYDAEQDELEIKYGLGDFSKLIGYRKKRGEGLAGKVLQTGRPFVVNNYSAWPDRDINPDFDEFGAMAGIPLQYRDEVLGVFVLATRNKSVRIGRDEAEILLNFARLASIALWNAALYDKMESEISERENTQKKLKNRVSELTTLNHITKTLTESTDLDAALKITVRHIGKLLNAHGGSFALINRLTNNIRIVAHFSGDDQGPDLTGFEIPSLPQFSIIFDEGKTMVIPDAQRSPVLEPVNEIIRARNIECMAVVPLKTPSKIIGAIILSTNDPDRQFTSDEVKLMETIAGQVAGVIENARLFEEAEKAKNIAEHANQSKSRFLANMSHEIRTPLNSVLGFTELLESLVSDSRAKNHIAAIKSSGKSLLNLINDILDLSKIEAGKIDIRPEPLNLKNLIEEVSRLFSPMITQKGLDCKCNISADVPHKLILDEARMRKVLFNLIGNAVKFTHHGHVTLTADAVPSPGVNHKIDVLIRIEDSGIGIPEDQHELIFSPFVQYDAGRNRKHGGTGLGLAICKRLIELMDGGISLKSQEQKGSCFEIYIPNVPVAESFRASAPESGFGADKTIFKHSTVLIVDDETSHQMLMKILLNELNIQVLQATDGKQAVEIAAHHEPDLILMDIRMPVMDGCEATRKIKGNARLKNIPVIAFTTAALKEDLDRIKQSGFDGYLIKPVMRQNIIKELSRHLQPSKSSSQKDLETASRNKKEENIAGMRLHPEIIQELKNNFLPEWEEINETLIFDEVADFAEKVSILGNSHNCQLILRWSDTVLRQVRNFDIKALEDTFLKFREFIKFS